jgi:signal transduction histidine kinase
LIADDLSRCAWVPPTAAGLLALARGTSGVWSQVRHDPGAVLLLLRQPHLSLSQVLHSTTILDETVRHLQREGEGSLIDWTDPRRARVHDFAIACATTADHLARLTQACDPNRAWLSGLLAPLGWIAVAAHAPDEAAGCLNDPAWLDAPARIEAQRWGLDQPELARRLARQWLLPDWLLALIGHLGLPADVAEQLGAELPLVWITQLAVNLVQQPDGGLHLAVGGTANELMRSLRLAALPEPSLDTSSTTSAPLTLMEHLALEAERRRLDTQAATKQLEAVIDVLHEALEDQRGREEEQLRQRKLRALAEFAAGAGHEINNPLAVISGQAQYLLSHEAEPARRTSLEKIIGQTQRIHGLLRELMQFARPPAPQFRSVDLVRVIDEVATALGELALHHKVRVIVRDQIESGQPPIAPAPCVVAVDEKQVRTALACLVKNAIQAAGPDGWVRVRIESCVGQVEVVIEDSGPGLDDNQREHLFDPFYSGRSAGRGAGLGLPTAWALARQQGGDVVLVSQPGETTRFVMRLPLSIERSQTLAG